MKFSVVVNNLNYGRYIRECVESVLSQQYPPHEVIVVDDGSTDDSLAILRQNFASDPRVLIVSQLSQGQTAAVARGIELATGEIICLLDSDDRYKPGCLQRLAAHYAEHPETDLAFWRYETIGMSSQLDNDFIWLNPQRDYDYGYTALATYFGRVTWIGNFTSTLSLRARLARTIKLHEIASEFYASHQADFAILLAASLLGGRKYYLHQALTEYRQHEKNHYRMSRASEEGQYTVRFTDAVRFNYWAERSHISEKMSHFLPIEAGTIPCPDPKHLEFYEKLIRRVARQQRGPWPRRLEKSIRNVRKRWFGRKAQ